MVRRIWISSDRVTVSKPGVDAASSPVDYKYVAMDSRLASGRPLEIGVVPNYTLGQVVPFTTQYQAPPAIDVTFFSSSVINFNTGPKSAYFYARSIGMRDANSSTAYNRTSYYFGVWANQFTIVDDFQFVRAAALNHPNNLFYVLWPTW